MTTFVKSALLDADHGFFTRQGGVSQGLYSSLNCGLGSQDQREHVLRNLELVRQNLDSPQADLITLSQIHSAKALTFSSKPETRPEADGMVTNEPGLILGILTADCAPVLFYEPIRRVIGACHAGWKGALGGILNDTVDKMEALGAARDQIRAAIGPCISVNSYEVDTAFFQKFIRQSADNEAFFRAGKQPSNCQFDLSAYVASRLRDIGLQARFVDALNIDTYKQEDLYFSYRRSCHRSEPDYGRQISCVTLR